MHLIDMSNNRANTAWVGQKPWHGLGQELEPNAPMHIWADAAGMNWTIKRSPVMFHYTPQAPEYAPLGETSIKATVPNRQVLYRSDNKSPLSVVSQRYQIVQPAEVLEFFRDLVGCNDFELDVAGCLDDGR